MADTEQALSFSSEHKRRAENLAFDLDVWYPQLQQFTFPTVFLPLTLAEASAVVHHYQERYLGWHGSLTADDARILQALEHRIDAALGEPLMSNGAFPRLCGRSLKDGDPLEPSQVVERYGSVLRGLRDSGATGPLEMQALFGLDWMKCSRGSEVMSLLLSSERAFVDLKDWAQFGEPEQLALRAWQPEITQEWEFRVFVYEGKLTGISQYDHYCCYPFLEGMKAKLQMMIERLWQRFHSHVGVESYVADVGYIQSRQEMVLIELGPFLPCTGASCFRWERDTDQLQRGPFEFRLRKPGEGLADETAAELVQDALFTWKQCRSGYASTLEGVLTSSANNHARGSRLRCLSAAAVVVLCWMLRNKGWVPRWLKASLGVGLLASAAVAARRCLTHGEHSGQTLLFVYGTLKRGFHWNRKFLSLRARFVAEAVSRTPQCLVVGRCGVPYVLLSEEGHPAAQCVKGELWMVDQETLAGLDEYEGVSKGYYGRKAVECLQGPNVVWAQMYGMVDPSQLWSPSELSELSCVPEYTLETHLEQYRAVEHILLKQQLYLAGAVRYNDLQEHVQPAQGEN